MALMRERDIRFHNLERKTGLFLFMAALLIVISVVSIGIRRDVFTNKVKIYLMADTGDNFSVGQAVKFKGFRIGKVSAVRLNEDGKVRVVLTILGDYVNFVREDSTAKLFQEGLIGDYMIEIVGGTGDVIVDGASIKLHRALSLGSIAADVQAQLEEIMEELKGAAGKIMDPEGNLLKTVKNIRTLSDELIVTNRNAQAFIANTDKLVSSLQNDIVPELERAVRSTGDMMSPETAAKVNKALDNMLMVSQDIKAATGQLPPLMQDTRQITGSLKQMWPISGGVENAKEEALTIDSLK